VQNGSGELNHIELIASFAGAEAVGLIIPIVAGSGLAWALEAKPRAYSVVAGVLCVLLLFVVSPLIRFALPPSSTHALVKSFFYAGLPEETLKLLALAFLARRHLLATSLGIASGFAAGENAVVLWYSSHPWAIIGIRLVDSLPAHLIFGAIAAACLLYFGSRWRGRLLAWSTVVLAHSAIDAFYFEGNARAAKIMLSLLGGILIALFAAQRLRRLSDAR
jgi:RsiW-degrading membrane proteinase PrsW (M82 family)